MERVSFIELLAKHGAVYNLLQYYLAQGVANECETMEE
jgi:hypothetical protein